MEQPRERLMLHELPAGRQSLRMARLSLHSMSMSSGISTHRSLYLQKY